MKIKLHLRDGRGEELRELKIDETRGGSFDLMADALTHTVMGDDTLRELFAGLGGGAVAVVKIGGLEVGAFAELMLKIDAAYPDVVLDTTEGGQWAILRVP